MTDFRLRRSHACRSCQVLTRHRTTNQASLFRSSSPVRFNRINMPHRLENSHRTVLYRYGTRSMARRPRASLLAVCLPPSHHRPHSPVKVSPSRCSGCRRSTVGVRCSFQALWRPCAIIATKNRNSRQSPDFLC